MPANYLAKTPANFRAEIARHRISQRDIARMIEMNPTYLSNLLNETGSAILYDWSANNIGIAINILTGRKLFQTREKLTRPKTGRPRRVGTYPITPADPSASQRRAPGLSR